MARSKPTSTPGAPARSIAGDLLEWYDRGRRDLPWRAGPGAVSDPYRVWLSEIMLQQTTVAAVKSYYIRFLTLWPSVDALASAPREEIMREWAGLGYYARARNLHDCAKVVVDRFGGTFPSTEEGLRSLPGIGEYTAAAIAAIAFGRASTVVDGNVERVISRLFSIDAPLPASKPAIRRIAEQLVPAARPGDFAQATMDLGATLCTPKSPACAICPVRPHCSAQAHGLERDLPRRLPKKTRPQRFGASAVIRRPDGAILVRTRPNSGLLGGMAEFFGTAWTEEAANSAILAGIADRSLVRKGTVDHVFTHFALRIEVYAGLASGVEPPDGCRWVSERDIGREPMSSLMLKVFDVSRGSGVVALDRNGAGLVGLAGTDQQNSRKGEDRKA